MFTLPEVLSRPVEHAPKRLVFDLTVISCLSKIWAVVLSVLRIWPGCYS